MTINQPIITAAAVSMASMAPGILLDEEFPGYTPLFLAGSVILGLLLSFHLTKEWITS